MTIFQASERPLILIGHDVGGIIIKQVSPPTPEHHIHSYHWTSHSLPPPTPNTILQQCLLEAINREQLDIINSTYGLIFFGVPTRGLDDTSISTMVQGQGNEDMIRSVASSCANGYLVELNNNFGRHFNHKDSRIVSFYETRMTPTYTQVSERFQPDHLISATGHTWSRWSSYSL